MLFRSVASTPVLTPNTAATGRRIRIIFFLFPEFFDLPLSDFTIRFFVLLILSSGESKIRIIEMTGIARQTLSRWISQEGWRELKACYGMTREEVTQKILSIINDAIEDPDEYLKKKKIADDLVKLAATIEKMDRSTNVVHYVEAFIRFEDWLMEHRKDYPELPDKVVAMLHGLHDDFLTPFFTKKP